MPVERHQAAMDDFRRRAGAKWAHRVGTRVVAEAKDRCPVDEGALRSSIDYTTAVDAQKAHVTVGSPLEYAQYVHEGTGIYGPKQTPIVPVDKKALKFRWEPTDGRPTKSKDKRGFVFFKSVKGQPPQPFLADALRAVMGTIRRTVN